MEQISKISIQVKIIFKTEIKNKFLVIIFNDFFELSVEKNPESTKFLWKITELHIQKDVLCMAQMLSQPFGDCRSNYKFMQK